MLNIYLQLLKTFSIFFFFWHFASSVTVSELQYLLSDSLFYKLYPLKTNTDSTQVVPFTQPIANGLIVVVITVNLLHHCLCGIFGKKNFSSWLSKRQTLLQRMSLFFDCFPLSQAIAYHCFNGPKYLSVSWISDLQTSMLSFPFNRILSRRTCLFSISLFWKRDQFNISRFETFLRESTLLDSFSSSCLHDSLLKRTSMKRKQQYT